VSFENDLDSLKLAVRHSDKFLYLRHSGPAGILESGRWQSRTCPGLSWVLVLGDFRETMMPGPSRPDLIFFDLFSSKTSAVPWTAATFREVFLACAGGPAELFTYSSSTAIRAALLTVGFYVARGCSTGGVPETTIALTPAALHLPSSDGRELLGADWLAKWDRSAAKFPAEICAGHEAAFEATIRGHLQFQRG
jgi:queuine tRNA-ribosyltransferase